MKEIIFLNFGNTSNFISTHFWNLNDELMKNEENIFNLEHGVIYDDYSRPRNIIFDYSENIRPYYLVNERLQEKELDEIESEMAGATQVKRMNMDNCADNPYLNMMNNISCDESKPKAFTSKTEDVTIQSDLPSLKDLLKLSDEELYEYFNFNSTVKNWNDFLQPKLPKIGLNEIKTVDVDIGWRKSYLRGNEFFSSHNFLSTYYESFEDSFRKYLENCDQLELLHINADFNSFWGGICTVFLEKINEQVPKTLEIVYAVDEHSSFFHKNNSFNEEKMINYLWFLSDLQAIKSDAIVMPIYKTQNPSVIKQIFSYQPQFNFDQALNSIDAVYDYYYTSICGLNLQSLYMPLRSKYYGNSSIYYNLLHNESMLNFIETDTIFHLDLENYAQEKIKTNGLLMNFSRTITSSEFTWKKMFEKAMNLNKFNSSVLHGYKNNYTILGDPIEKFLVKLSGVNYTCEDRFDLPICFPRKVFYKISDGSYQSAFTKNVTALCNYRPFPDFCLKNLKYFPLYLKENESLLKKYLISTDPGNYIDFKEKSEVIYNLIELYDGFAENYFLIDFGQKDNEEEIDI